MGAHGELIDIGADTLEYLRGKSIGVEYCRICTETPHFGASIEGVQNGIIHVQFYCSSFEMEGKCFVRYVKWHQRNHRSPIYVRVNTGEKQFQL
jgi:hypothetical protein